MMYNLTETSSTDLKNLYKKREVLYNQFNNANPNDHDQIDVIIHSIQLNDLDIRLEKVRIEELNKFLEK